MQAWLIALFSMAVSGLCFLAYEHPNAFLAAYPYFQGAVFVGYVAWQAFQFGFLAAARAVQRKMSSAMPDLEELSGSPLVLNPFLPALCFAGCMIFLQLLMDLPKLLEI
ncbi:hypothetical protein D5400_16860 [Georhizobium profundi]|uniref:Uncharacterized protein n=1 Tax=Georhizobium profundi TaxID=2341112 RepID=A0A3Q8XQ06_9HYPH|nr:hypothetical protein [Georhizobium profundi]AZN72721.1 hypothetical protein D5400_16860 [Georhizobium profundi]